MQFSLLFYINFIRTSKLGEQIAALTEDIKKLNFKKAQLLSQLHCQDNGVVSKKQKLKNMDSILESLKQHTSLYEQKETDKAQSLEIKDSIPPENKDAIVQEHKEIRTKHKVGLVQKLYATYRDKYNSATFDETNRQIDRELLEQPIQKKKHSISQQLKTLKQKTPQPKKHKKEYKR